jgi:HEPN domain-containing protein
MEVLFSSKRYSDTLFFGHIILEKIIKAHIVKQTKQQTPYSHNLIMLAEQAQLDLTDEEWKLLGTVNEFNIRTGYPEQKLDFYKKCTKKYTENYLQKIKLLYKKLCQTIKK